MVGVAGHDDSLVPCVPLSHPQRQVIGLGAGARIHHLVDGCGHGGKQTFRVIDDALVEIPRVGVEGGQLPGDRADDVRVAMAHACHVVVGIEVAVALAVEEVTALAAHQVHRPLVEQPIGRAENPFPGGDQRFGGRVVVHSGVAIRIHDVGKAHRSCASSSTVLPRSS
ncbi:Uncharacterised protein [Mycobacteroides abscessus subsp. abscessus]|nr:Uncharacterised protein [Mycobacteroides abscessus subsp. abscessus]